MPTGKGTLKLSIDHVGLPWVFVGEGGTEENFSAVFQDWLDHGKGSPVRLVKTDTSCALVLDEDAPDKLTFEGSFAGGVLVVEVQVCQQLLEFVDFMMKNAPRVSEVAFDELQFSVTIDPTRFD